ncbi:MAG: CsgG/HfaB family protein [Chlorobium sp.]|jgi:Peptidoglycan-synthase activator LpoB|nr:MAG: hypothetical protein FDX12_02705 [Chlorobium sp.]
MPIKPLRYFVAGVGIIFAGSMMISCDKIPDLPFGASKGKLKVASEEQQKKEPEGVKPNTIIVSGTGPTEKEAITEALVMAVSKIRGVSVSSEDKKQIKEYQETHPVLPGQKVTEGSHQQDVRTSTQGFIPDYTVLESQKSGSLFSSEYTVKLEVVAPSKYHAGVEIKRKKLAVVPLRIPKYSAGEGFAKNWMQDLEVSLVQSGRFAMLDRSFAEVTKNETDQYSNGDFSDSELARQGQKSGTDYIVTGELIKYSSTESQNDNKGDRKKSPSNVVGIRIIDVSTGQVKFAKNYSEKANVAFSDIIDFFFPISLVGLNGSEVIIGQGGENIEVGQKYGVFSLGQVLKDPYTGESLGRTETSVGLIEVTASGFKTSQAKILSGYEQIKAGINSGLIIRKIKPEVLSENKDNHKSVHKTKKINLEGLW